MPTIIRRKRKKDFKDLKPNVINFLETGSTEKMDFELLPIAYPNTGKSRADAYKLYQEKGFLDGFIRKNPGTRPYIWWEIHSKYRRRRIGGTGDLYEPDFVLGMPDEAGFLTKEDREFEISQDPKFDGVAVDPHDPPRFESQTEFLKRQKITSFF